MSKTVAMVHAKCEICKAVLNLSEMEEIWDDLIPITGGYWVCNKCYKPYNKKEAHEPKNKLSSSRLSTREE